jgi:phenylalanyl-tRNA synthetase beta subunit
MSLTGRMPESRLDFYDLKGVVEVARRPAWPGSVSRFEAAADVPWFHPGRAATWSGWRRVARSIGSLGQLHPRLAAGYKVRQPILLAEVRLSGSCLRSGRRRAALPAAAEVSDRRP